MSQNSPSKDVIEQDILAEFDKTQKDRVAFADTIHWLIENLIPKEINVHSIKHRCKDRDSLLRKIRRPDKHYKSLSNITDLAGLRIVTYFDDEVDMVYEIINKEFSVDSKNSVDKRKIDPERFGYRSLHCVISMTDERCDQLEYASCKGYKAEIQICSILQHTWAEIEHDLGYKSKLTVPRHIRRKFSQLAGLLEIADSQFVLIRNELKDYSEELHSYIEQSPGEVLIDRLSLSKLIMINTRIRDVEQRIAANNHKQLLFNDHFIDRLVYRLRYFYNGDLGGRRNTFDNVQDILDLWEKYERYIESFAKVWLQNKNYTIINNGISLLYLLYLYLGVEMDLDPVEDFARYFDLTHDNEGFAQMLITVADNVRKQVDTRDTVSPL